MARYPGATWRPLPMERLSGARMAAYNRVNLHVTAGNGSPFGTFNRPNAASSHLFVFKDGTSEQYVDTDYRAEADLQGNDATISVETEGAAPGVDANAEPWTPEQVETLARIFAWAVQTHGIAVQIAHDSKIGDSSKGLSWHRLGIDGNFDAAHPGRRQLGGGMLYSPDSGKVCPGNAKIDQAPAIFAFTAAQMPGPFGAGGAWVFGATAGDGASEANIARSSGLVASSTSTSRTAARVPSRQASETAWLSPSARASMMPSNLSSWSLSCLRCGRPLAVVVDMEEPPLG